jgi:Family of unknown function (DUF6519)
MPGDVDRVTFLPDLMFANVDLQQGRLLLPSAFNEQSAIHHYFLRTFIVDLVGRSWRAGTGFTIGVESSAHLKIQIGSGHYYVDGILCRNGVDCAYEDQPFGPTPDDLANLKDEEGAVYLDCWERQVSWLNYPSLRDPALEGKDTATRVQIAWQVRLLSKTGLNDQLGELTEALKARVGALDSPADADMKKALQKQIKDLKTMADAFTAGADCNNTAKVLDALDAARPRMAADAKRSAENPDPCAIAPDSEYRGRENQLYRVEIHRPGLAGQATFKWSRENGSVAFKVIDINPDSTGKVTRLTLESLGHDRRSGLCEGDWVELVDDDSEFRWQPLPLLQVTKIDGQRRMVTLNGLTEPALNLDRHALLRRWDQQGDDKTEGAILVMESKADGDWILIERGVWVRFLPGAVYGKGDYWLIPARVATGDIEWPSEGNAPLALEPNGIIHHRAALAIVKKSKEEWKAVGPCGCRRDPLCGA